MIYFVSDLFLTLPPPAPTMQPESSDGFASVGTILPEEGAALLPGGSFRFCPNSARVRLALPTRLRKPSNETRIDLLLFYRAFVRFLCWGLLEAQFVTSHCLLDTILFKRACALCKACLAAAAHPPCVDRKWFSEVSTLCA
jgi:hypothetical protein